MFLAIGRRHQHLDVLADHLVGRIAEELLTSFVKYQHLAGGIDQDHAIDSGVNRSSEQSLVVAPRRFHLLPFGDFFNNTTDP